MTMVNAPQGIDRMGAQPPSKVVGISGNQAPAAPSRQAPKAAPFEEVLQKTLSRGPEAGSKLRFSAHAQERLRSREIQLDSAGVARLEQAVDRAGQKGARDSLVLMDDLALLVNVRNRVVVTAVPQSSAKDNVFTNIDSVVIA